MTIPKMIECTNATVYLSPFGGTLKNKDGVSLKKNSIV